jgi:hypothetical protein
MSKSLEIAKPSAVLKGFQVNDLLPSQLVRVATAHARLLMPPEIAGVVSSNDVRARRELFQAMVAAHDLTPRQIYQLWQAIFPGDFGVDKDLGDRITTATTH